MPWFYSDEGTVVVRQNQSPENVQIVRLVLADNLTETVKVTDIAIGPLKSRRLGR